MPAISLKNDNERRGLSSESQLTTRLKKKIISPSDHLILYCENYSIKFFKMTRGAQRFFACASVGECIHVCFPKFSPEAFLQEGSTLPSWCMRGPTGNLLHGRRSRAASGILCPDRCCSKSVFSSFWVRFLLCSCSRGRPVCLELAGRGETHRLGSRQGPAPAREPGLLPEVAQPPQAWRASSCHSSSHPRLTHCSQPEWRWKDPAHTESPTHGSAAPEKCHLWLRQEVC